MGSTEAVKMMSEHAKVAELVDAQDSDSCGQIARGGSSPPFRTILLLILLSALVLLAGCKSDEQKYMEESFALHEEVFALLERNTSDPAAAIAQLTELESNSREHRAEVKKKLQAALNELTDQERKAFTDKARKRYDELRTKFGEIIKAYPDDQQNNIQRLISTITR
jgi:hypothetical protein